MRVSSLSLSSTLIVQSIDFVGKGTQCVRISKTFGYVHLSAGDLLREEAAKTDSTLGQQINDHIKNGSIVPVAITCKLLENVSE